MAFISVSQPARARLAQTKGVTIINNPAPRDPAAVAAILAGIRYMEIRAEGDAFRAAIHVRQGEWLLLAYGVDEDAAFAAVAAFVAKVAGIPQSYAPEHDAAERVAAAEVLAAFAAPLSLPLAA